MFLNMSIVLHFVFFDLSPSNFYSCLSLPMNDSSSHRTHRRPVPRPIVPAIAPNDGTPPPKPHHTILSFPRCQLRISSTNIRLMYVYVFTLSTLLYLSICLAVCKSIYQSVYPPSHPATHRSVCLLIRRSVLPSIQSSNHPCIHSGVPPPTYLSESYLRIH